MRIIISTIFIYLSTLLSEAFCSEYLYILNDKCINNLAENAEKYFNQTPVSVIRDSRGIILRFGLESPENEYNALSGSTCKNIIYISQFLAKNKNPVIIEVHTNNFSPANSFEIKNWEMSVVIANNIEELMHRTDWGENLGGKIHSVGYGEFLPLNTSNNGSNSAGRVDIIVLCNISGE